MKPEHKINDIVFDSREEWEFYHWCLEAKGAGWISNFEYHPRPLPLAPVVELSYIKKLKKKEVTCKTTLLRPHVYTADFLIVACKKIDGLKVPLSNVLWIDIKGTFNRFGGDREFSINQKWIYDKYGIYVNKVVPKKFFKETWVPEACLRHKTTGKRLEKYEGYKTIKDMEETNG